MLKTNETGRSMVEMLGVLAIIGVLSVAGIAGYTMAMRRHRANEIVQVASVLAITAQSADQGTGDCISLTSSNLIQKPSGVEIVADATLDDSSVDVRIQAPDEICNVIATITSDYECVSAEIQGCDD